MDTYVITPIDLNELTDIAERLQRLIGRIIGREEAIKARRDEFKLIDITAELTKKKFTRTTTDRNGIFGIYTKGDFKNASFFQKRISS